VLVERVEPARLVVRLAGEGDRDGAQPAWRPASRGEALGEGRHAARVHAAADQHAGDVVVHRGRDRPFEPRPQAGGGLVAVDRCRGRHHRTERVEAAPPRPPSDRGGRELPGGQALDAADQRLVEGRERPAEQLAEERLVQAGRDAGGDQLGQLGPEHEPAPVVPGEQPAHGQRRPGADEPAARRVPDDAHPVASQAVEAVLPVVAVGRRRQHRVAWRVAVAGGPGTAEPAVEHHDRARLVDGDRRGGAERRLGRRDHAERAVEVDPPPRRQGHRGGGVHRLEHRSLRRLAVEPQQAADGHAPADRAGAGP